MKYLLFGTGDYYERYKKWFPPEDILALLDNSVEKQNCCLDEIQVLAPEEGIRLPFDVIVILSFYVKEMREQLIDLGVSESQIFHFYDLHGLIYKKENKKPIQYYRGNDGFVENNFIYYDRNGLSGKNVLLLSQDLTLGGPAIALFHGAKILSAHGYHVTYASMIDGPLREQLLSENIPVIVDHNLQIETMRDAEWTSSFDLILCNTINFHVFLSDRDTTIPVIWWLHDSSFFYNGVNAVLLRELNRKNLYLVSVGSIPANAIRKIIPDISVETLLYGVADQKDNRDNMTGIVNGTYFEKSHKVCFVTIGYIEARKGQDILIKAIRLLSNDVREKATFYLVGQDTSMMAQQLKCETETMPEVVIMGTVGRKEIGEILDNADVLVCPSREDPMPTVAAEAMMYEVPCLISDAAGTAEYIQDGLNGFIFHSEDEWALAEKIKLCILHCEKLNRIGRESRKIYEKCFSMRTFEEKLLAVVERCF